MYHRLLLSSPASLAGLQQQPLWNSRPWPSVWKWCPAGLSWFTDSIGSWTWTLTSLHLLVFLLVNNQEFKCQFKRFEPNCNRVLQKWSESLRPCLGSDQHITPVWLAHDLTSQTRKQKKYDMYPQKCELDTSLVAPVCCLFCVIKL